MKEAEQKVVIVTGHQRSGTTLLQLLCNAHPQMVVTPEFGFYINCHLGYSGYRKTVLNRWWVTKYRALTHGGSPGLGQVVRNSLLVARFLIALGRHRHHWSGLTAIGDGLRQVFPGSKVVGDKYPDYIFGMDRMVGPFGPLCLVIFRDPRDVVNSTLQKVRTDWRDREFAKKMNTAEKIADRWLEAVDAMQSYSESIYIIRYEDLVSDPQTVLGQLADRLDVRRDGFPFDWVRADSLGKFKQGLSASELGCVLDRAGSKMKELGYSL
jgi:hypothetical protein